MIQVKCPSDGTLHYADDNIAGRTIRCRTCGATLKIESPDHVQSIESQPEPVEAISGRDAIVVAPKDAKPNVTSPVKSPRWVYILGGAGLGASVVLLFIFFGQNKPSSVSTRSTPGKDSVSVSDNSHEESPGSGAKSTERRPTSVEPGEEKTGRLGNGPLPPCAQGRLPSRLRTGERIAPDGEVSGQSNIRIMDGGDLDAAVRLVDSVTGKTSRFVYINAGDTFVMEGIGAGAYKVRFQFGEDWIPDCRGFVRDSAFGEFSDPLVFLDDRIRFYTVTLSPAIGGATRTRKIDRRKFYEGDQGVVNSQ